MISLYILKWNAIIMKHGLMIFSPDEEFPINCPKDSLIKKTEMLAYYVCIKSTFFEYFVFFIYIYIYEKERVIYIYIFLDLTFNSVVLPKICFSHSYELINDLLLLILNDFSSIFFSLSHLKITIHLNSQSMTMENNINQNDKV